MYSCAVDSLVEFLMSNNTIIQCYCYFVYACYHKLVYWRIAEFSV